VTDPTLPAPQSAPQPAPKPSRAHTSRQRLAEFVDDYRHHRLDDKLEEQTQSAAPEAGSAAAAVVPATGSAQAESVLR